MNAETFTKETLAKIATVLESDGDEETLAAEIHALAKRFASSAAAPPDGRITIVKADQDRQMVWGWALVSVEKGQPVCDLQGDEVDTDELQHAVHGSFMRNGRVGKRMHGQRYAGATIASPVGEVVDSIVFTKALQDALGIDLGREGWFVGMKIHKKAVWEEVKAGKLSAFSIGGEAERHPIGKAGTEPKALALAARKKARVASAKANVTQKPEHHKAASTACYAAAAACKDAGQTDHAAAFRKKGFAHNSKAVGAFFRKNADGPAMFADLFQGGPVQKSNEAPRMFAELYKAEFAYTPDPAHPSQNKLNISDARHVAGAVAALGPKGYRGNRVAIPDRALADVKARVRAAYRRFFPGKPLPAVLAKYWSDAARAAALATREAEAKGGTEGDETPSGAKGFGGYHSTARRLHSAAKDSLRPYDSSTGRALPRTAAAETQAKAHLRSATAHHADALGANNTGFRSIGGTDHAGIARLHRAAARAWSKVPGGEEMSASHMRMAAAHQARI